MKACPACHGDGGFAFEMNTPLERLCAAVGVPYESTPVVTCDTCDGEGTVTEQLARDYSAYWTARTDQLLAGVDDGTVKI